MSVATRGLDVASTSPYERSIPRQRRVGIVLRRNPRLAIGGALVVLLVLVAIFAPLLTRFDPTLGDVSDSLQAPSATHWLGTDDQGRDVMARVLFGSRISLSVAAISVTIGT